MPKRFFLAIFGLFFTLGLIGCGQTTTTKPTNQQPAYVPRPNQWRVPKPQQTQNQSSQVVNLSPATPTNGQIPFDENKNNWKTYANTKYGFKITYPEQLSTINGFDNYHLLTTSWRTNAPSDSKGEAVVRIPIYHIENGSNYPNYYATGIRIGVSTNPNDVQKCTSPDPNSNVTPTHANINGIDFTVFPIQNGAAQQYIVGSSYRTVHNNTCYVIEQLKNGSNYHGTPNPKDISDTVLNGYYNFIPGIIQTFQFTK